MARPGKQFVESAHAVRRVFENPSLRRIELAFAGSSIGRYALLIVVTIYTYRHGGVTAVAIVTVARQAGCALVAPVVTALTERLRRERVMLAADLGRVACAVALAVLAAADAPSDLIYALSVLSPMVGISFRPAEAALLTRVARTPEELTAANVTSSTFDSVGVFAGPALGALLVAAVDYTAGFVLVACAFAWSAFCVVRIPTPDGAHEAHRPHEGAAGLETFLAGFRAIGGQSKLRLLVGLYAAQCLAAGALGVLLVAAALSLLHTGNAGVGLLQSACGIGAVVGAGVSLALLARGKLAADFGLGLVLWGAPLLAIGAAPHAWVAALALVVLGAGNSIVDISAVTLIQRSAPTELTARVFGVLESVIIVGLGIGALVTPALVHWLGIRGSLLAVGALLPVLAALSARGLAAIDRSALIPAAQIAALRAVPFLAVLPAQTIELLAGRMRLVELPAGTTLFSAGDTGDAFYVLASGTLAIELPDGTLKAERAPGYVGEIALLRDVPRTATVRAGEDAAALWALERDDFLGAVTGHELASSRADAVVGIRLGAASAG